jgi:hypothetical protein
MRTAAVARPQGAISDTRGGALTEYVIWTGVVALLALQAFRAFGTHAANTIHEQGADVAKLGL